MNIYVSCLWRIEPGLINFDFQARQKPNDYIQNVFIIQMHAAELHHMIAIQKAVAKWSRVMHP